MTQIAKEKEFVDVETLRENRYQTVKEGFIDLIQRTSDAGDTEILINEETFDNTTLCRIKTELKEKGYKIQHNHLTGILTISWGLDE